MLDLGSNTKFRLCVFKIRNSIDRYSPELQTDLSRAQKPGAALELVPGRSFYITKHYYGAKLAAPVNADDSDAGLSTKRKPLTNLNSTF